MKMKCALVALFAVAVVPQVHAQKMSVKIVNRMDRHAQSVYTVPGYSNTNCYATGNSNYASSSCNETGSPAKTYSYTVNGATFSLLLPDGRLAVVTCGAKVNWTGVASVYRSCRQPIGDTVDVDFHGDSAKLEWPVSLDGKKTQSETYKVLGVLGRDQ